MPYDIFISYARENFDWVKENLYAPLLHCRLANGQRPNIFLDTDKIKVGQDWAAVLVDAIQSSRYFIPVYSELYFQKPMCEWEMKQAWQRDPTGGKGILMPILLDHHILVPALYQLIQYNKVTPNRDWFGELCQQMNLIYATDETTLRFVTQPTDSYLNHTLNPIHIEVLENGQLSKGSHRVTIEPSAGNLQGTLLLETIKGKAVFEDLSISEPSTGIQLRLSALACTPISSDSFSVLPAPLVPMNPVAIKSPDPALEEPSLLDSIRAIRPPVFLDDSQSFAVFVEDGLRFFEINGKSLTPQAIRLEIAEPRLVRQNRDTLFLADWFGKVQAIDKTGLSQLWDLRENEQWTIVSEIISQGDEICLALWNGNVYRLLPNGQKEILFQHAGGIQCLQYKDGLFIVVDFEERALVYENGHLVDSAPIESSVAYLHPCANYFLAFGDTLKYQLHARPLQVFSEPHHMSMLLGSLAGTNETIVVDANGRGFQFDEQLITRSAFRTVPNAMPKSADRNGRYCVLANPDGSHSLVLEGKIVFSTSNESIVVSPNGDYFLFSADSAIRILSHSQLEQYLKG